eukprot:1132914-Pelagomonas_calceolata.AAC.4
MQISLLQAGIPIHPGRGARRCMKDPNHCASACGCARSCHCSPLYLPCFKIPAPKMHAHVSERS